MIYRFSPSSLTFLFLILIPITSCKEGNTPRKWGLYQIYWNPTQFIETLEKELNILEATPDHIMFFRDLNPSRSFPSKAVAYLHQRNTTPIISIELTDWHNPQRDFLKAINAGEFDTYFQHWFKASKAHSSEIIYRFGFEMNGNWFLWGQRPEEFKKAWKRVYQIYQISNATHVKWLFSPNIIYDKKSDFKPYYPGDDFVHYVGLDGYNFGDNHDQYHRWQSYNEVFKESLNALSAFNKPMMIAEIGSADGVKKAEWLEDFLKRYDKSKLFTFVYFNYDKRREGEPNWRLDSDRKSLKVFKNWLKKD